MTLQTWNTASLGLGLIALCLAGVSTSVASPNRRERQDMQLAVYESQTANILLEICRRLPQPFGALLESVVKMYSGNKRRATTPVPPQVVEIDTTIITHSGSCQCRAIMFTIEAPRSLDILKGTPRDDDESIKSNPNSTFPKTIVPQKNFTIVQGSEHVRNYQEPYKQDDSINKHILSVYARALNPNTIQTFCGKCGTQLLWKPYHAQDQPPLLHINVLCLTSDWMAMPQPKQESVEEAASPVKIENDETNRPTRIEGQDLRKCFPVVSSMASIHSEHSQSTSQTRSLRTPPVVTATQHAKADLPIVSPEPEIKRTSIRPDVIHEQQPFRSKSVEWQSPRAESGLSDEPDENDQSVGSETASTITTSSFSMASGWRLRDPSQVWSSTATAITSDTASVATLEERLNDKASQDALLYQMRKHLASHAKKGKQQVKTVTEEDVVPGTTTPTDSHESSEIFSTPNEKEPIPVSPWDQPSMFDAIYH